MTPRWLAAIMGGLAVVVFAFTPSAAHGQAPDRSPRQMLADQLVGLADSALKSSYEPGPNELGQARVLLDLALELNPDDQELWLLRGELAGIQGDHTTQALALGRYCKIVPQDDVAQLRLIQLKLADRQTVEARLAALERVLDAPAAGAFGGPLLSRLSSLAAEAAMELGREEEFVRHLKEALNLDATNLHAARLARDWFVLRHQSNETIGQALVQVVLAQPVDPAARLDLADWLLGHGAFAAAATQYQAGAALSPRPVSASAVFRWTIALASQGQTDQALNLLRQYEQSLQAPPNAPGVAPGTTPGTAPAASGGSQASATGTAGAQATGPQGTGLANRRLAPGGPASASDQTEPSPAPGFTGLPADLELLRLAILVHVQQPAKAAGSLNRLRSLITLASRQGDPKAAEDLAWLDLLFPSDPLDVKSIEKIQVEFADSGRLSGWAKLRRADLAEARQTLLAHARKDTFAMYGLALTYPDQDNPNRVALLRRIVETSSGTLAGLLANFDLAKAKQAFEPSAPAQMVMRRLDALPRSLLLPDLSQRPWVALRVATQPADAAWLEPFGVRLTITNTSDMPLSLGPDGAIPSQALLFLSPRSGGQSLGNPPPIVVDVHRRLRLEPRQSLELPVRLDRGDLGARVTDAAGQTISLALTPLLGPVASEQGGISAGPMGATAASQTIRRRALAASAAMIDQWLASLENPDPSRRLWAAAALLRASGGLDPARDQAIRTRVTETLLRSYQQMTDVEQAWVVRFLPQGAGRSDDPFAAIRQLAVRGDSPLVRITYLASQISDPASPDLQAAQRHQNPKISGFAALLRAHLEAVMATQEPQADRPSPSPAG